MHFIIPGNMALALASLARNGYGYGFGYLVWVWVSAPPRCLIDAAALDFPERSTRGRCCCAAVQHWWIGEVAAAAEAAAPLVGLGLICIGP